MHIIDIIIFLALGAFIISRFLGFKLPKAKKQTRRRASKGARKPENILDFPKAPTAKHPAPEDVIGGEDEGTYTPKPNQKEALTGIAAIKAADPTFTQASFLKGAKTAYQFYYDAYNQKDDDALANLLAPILLNDHIETFNTLDAKGHTPQITIEKIEKATLADARLNGKTMLIDVQFTAQQTENMTTKTGKLVGGKTKSKATAKTVKSLWTFARPTNSDDPNWDVQFIQRAS